MPTIFRLAISLAHYAASLASLLCRSAVLPLAVRRKIQLSVGCAIFALSSGMLFADGVVIVQTRAPGCQVNSGLPGYNGAADLKNSSGVQMSCVVVLHTRHSGLQVDDNQATVNGGPFVLNPGETRNLGGEDWFMCSDAVGEIGYDYYELVSASPVLEFTLTINSNPEGTGTTTPNGSAKYAAGTSASVTAAAPDGYSFTGWSGASSSTEPSVTVLMDADKTMTANFAARPKNTAKYTLTTSIAGSGSVDPSGVSQYDLGSRVSVTATADAGFHFVSWSGAASGNTNPLPILMNTDVAVTATFEADPQPPQSYTVTVSKSGSGSVIPQGSADYVAGTVISVTASADPGNHFASWSGDAPTGAGASFSLTVNSVKNVTANFAADVVTTPPVRFTLSTRTAGNGTVSPAGDNDYDQGSDVSVTATAASGNHFTSWTGDASGSANPLTVHLDAAKSVTANFAADVVTPVTYTLVTTMNGSGSASPYGANDYAAGTVVSVSATPDQGNHFVNWTGDITSTDNPLSVTVDSNKTINANFAHDAVPPPQYGLTINVGGGGTATPFANSTQNFAAGTNVSITAVPDAGYAFSGWSGDVGGTTNPVEVTVDSAKSVTATFSPASFSLTTLASGGGTIDPPGVTGYQNGALVSLTASPSPGNVFSGWSGSITTSSNPATVTMNGDKIVIATFSAAPPPSRTLLVSAGSGGNVTPIGSTTYPDGSMVLVSATPAAGYLFAGWAGDASGTVNPLTVTMNADKTISASFTPATYSLTTQSSGGGTVVPAGTGSFAAGTYVTLTATSNSGYSFSFWAGDASGTSTPLSVLIDQNKSVTAVFSQNMFTVTALVAGSGVVTGAGIFAEGSTVTLVATPAAGNIFSAWSGDATGSSSSLSFVVHGTMTVTATFTAAASQSIAFPVPAGVKYPGPKIALNATSSSGLPVSYSVVSGPASVAGNIVTLSGAGAVVIQADQAGDASFLAAPAVRVTMSVAAGPGVVLKRDNRNKIQDGEGQQTSNYISEKP